MSVIRPISTVSRNVCCVWLSIYTATANSCTVGNENVLLGFFVGGWDSNQKVVLRVIAEKTPSGYGCLSKKCEQGEHEAVTLLCLVSSPSTPTYRLKTQDLKHIDYHD